MKRNKLENQDETAVKGAVLYLLLLITLVQMIWPITQIGQAADGTDNPYMVLIYQFLYMTLMVAGIIVARDNRVLSRILIVLGVGWFICHTRN